MIEYIILDAAKSRLLYICIIQKKTTVSATYFVYEKRIIGRFHGNPIKRSTAEEEAAFISRRSQSEPDRNFLAWLNP